MAATTPDISIVVPTYGREMLLIDTITALLQLEQPAAELLVIDQTPEHTPGVQHQLQAWDSTARIRWLRRSQPSITQAMNAGLQSARSPVVLFLDDDIIPAPGLVAAHAAAQQDPTVWGVVGQVLQPGEEPRDVRVTCRRDGWQADLGFPYYSTKPMSVANVMAGNLSVKREQAIASGGFDNNFRSVAYRFETEFAQRLIRSGGQIRFEPAASIRHLRAARGGTRIQGNHLASASPNHGVGDYYFALLHGWRFDVVRYVSWRMVREVCTKFHLRHPWYIPVKLVGEVRAFCWAWQLRLRGPALIGHEPACRSE